jgi:hypothetical protein
MTIVPILIGGLGNRLYQIANAFRLQSKHDADLKFYRINPKLSDVPKYRHLILRPSDFDDFGGHELLIKEGLPKSIDEIFPNFNFEVNPTEIDEILLNKNLYYENNINSLDSTRDAVVMGYFFSYSFVKKAVNRVKESFNPSIQLYIDSKYPELKTRRVLGIHLRLGINSDNNPALQIDPNFYSSIIEKEKNNTDMIFVVSDNIGRSKDFMSMVNTHGKEVKFIEEEPMFVDLLVLSNCNALIIAPSTLSAWSAYMNDHKNIYVPRIWTKHHWTTDVPLEWKLL